MMPEEILNVLKKEALPATGCTEPVAIALTTAQACKLVSEDVKKIKMCISCNVYKNAKAVGIPGTIYTGVNLAVALGVVLQDPSLDMTIFSNLNDEDVNKAQLLLKEVPVIIEIVYDVPSVYIDVEVQTNSSAVRAVTSGYHTNLTLLEKDGEIVLNNQKEEAPQKPITSLTKFPLENLIEKILGISPSLLEFLLEGIELNLKVANAGMSMKEGLMIGTRWKNLMNQGFLGDDLTNNISHYTAAACDARMAGVQLPVMSSAGSGNHGLVAIIPIALAAQELKCSKEKTAQALAVSHIVTIYVKEYIGRLSPICGCGVAAGAGASAGLTHLLGGDVSDIIKAIKNIVSSLAGMICDGGKVGCALKLSSSASTAWYCALLAKEGLEVPSGNGIVEENVNDTLSNLCKISREGMAHVDKAIVSVLEKYSA